MRLPTQEEFLQWKESHKFQVSADEAYLWIMSYVKFSNQVNIQKNISNEDPAIQHHSSKQGYERVNYWINAPKEEKCPVCEPPEERE